VGVFDVLIPSISAQRIGLASRKELFWGVKNGGVKRKKIEVEGNTNLSQTDMKHLETKKPLNNRYSTAFDWWRRILRI
jgi:hypothetical protein